LFSCDTNNPNPDPATTNGTSRYHPESARGTTGINTTNPAVRNTKPHRMMPAGRLFPALFPASIATPNMVNDSGASRSR